MEWVDAYDRREVIEDGLTYIEENLKAEVTARELADRAGYSLYRYYRLFQEVTGMPVMRYILRRRLLGAAVEIMAGRRKIDAALDYGFDTHAGFYRTFRREFVCTHSAYIKSGGVCPPKEEKMEINATYSGRPATVRDFYEKPDGPQLAGDCWSFQTRSARGCRRRWGAHPPAAPADHLPGPLSGKFSDHGVLLGACGVAADGAERATLRPLLRRRSGAQREL